MTSAPQHTPSIYLTRMAAKHPGCWQKVDAMRAIRGNGLPDWPSWCFLPLSGIYAILSGGPNRLSLEKAGEIAAFGALAAWRATQGIYRIHPTVRAAIESTPLEGEIPVEVLHCLPEWCIYVETPGLVVASQRVTGFFAYLECDARTGRSELRLVLECPPFLIGQMAIHLDHGTVEAGIAAAVKEGERNIHSVPPDLVAAFRAELPPATLAQEVSPLVNIVLYLCTQNSEIRDAAGRREKPEMPQPTLTKRGPRLFPPDRPTVWEIGVRLGAALESAGSGTSGTEDGSHASPRPHIRRAHWHHYLTGPRSGAQTPILRWLPPIAVNVDESHPLVPTVRPVDS